MIRRTVRGAAGFERWLLISQVDHARIAGQMAAAWRGPLVESPDGNGELLEAIFHHDDGWAAWEQSPDVDPQTGRPLDFTEMPLEESLSIWSASIAGAERIGPLAAGVVSRHFCALLEQSLSAGRIRTDDQRRAADGFLRDLGKRCQEPFLIGDPRCPPYGASEKVPDTFFGRGLAWLQMFDLLSLWLCCREQGEPLHVQPPDGPRQCWTQAGAGRVTVAPWPFTSSTVELHARAREVAAAHYPTREALAQASLIDRRLGWTLSPTAGP